MPPKLSTGKLQVPSRSSEHTGLPGDFRGVVREYNDNQPLDNVVYPYGEKERALLVIQPGQQMILTGYDLQGDTHVAISKVLVSKGVPAQGTTGCCPVITIGRSVRLRKVVMPCWKLDRCNPVFVIKTPGYYEIDVVGDTSEALVTAVSSPLQEVNVFAQTAPCACGN